MGSSNVVVETPLEDRADAAGSRPGRAPSQGRATLSRLLPPRVRRLGLAVLSGLALWWSFPGHDVWVLAPVGVGLLALATCGATTRQGALIGLLGGLAFFLPTLHWTGIYVGALPWVALCVSQAVFVALLGGVQAFLQSSPTRLRRGAAPAPGPRVRPVVVGLAWVLQEALRDRVPYGGFPWVRLAFGQSDSPLGRLAPVFGAPGVTFAVAVTGGLLAVAAHRLVGARRTRGHRLTPVLALVGAVAFAVVGLLVPLATDGPTANVMAVQGNVPTVGLEFNAQRRAVLDYHVAATLQGEQAVVAGTAAKPDLVVWPENSSDIDPERNADAGAQILRAVHAVDAPLVVGALLEQPLPNLSNASLLYVPGSSLPVGTYVKQHPVPFAEYIPSRSFFRIFSDKVDLVRSDFAAGKEPVVFRVPSAGGTPIVAGPTICFEVAYDDLMRDNVDLGANLLLVQTNNATFGYTDESVQQLAISRERAMELGRSIVHISTVGVSALVTPDGTAHQQTSLYTRAVLSGALPLRTTRTLAVRVGDWPEYAGCALLLALVGTAVGSRRRHRRRHRRGPVGAPGAAH